MADNTITTRKSVATETQTSPLIESYSSDNLLSDVWPYMRGRRWATGFAISAAYDIYAKVKKSSSGGK